MRFKRSGFYGPLRRFVMKIEEKIEELENRIETLEQQFEQTLCVIEKLVDKLISK